MFQHCVMLDLLTLFCWFIFWFWKDACDIDVEHSCYDWEFLGWCGRRCDILGFGTSLAGSSGVQYLLRGTISSKVEWFSTWFTISPSCNFWRSFVSLAQIASEKCSSMRVHNSYTALASLWQPLYNSKWDSQGENQVFSPSIPVLRWFLLQNDRS